jgi:hypothetical protein
VRFNYRSGDGFTPPSGDTDKRIAAIQVRPHNWLPGIEVRGEGVFLQLNMKLLSDDYIAPSSEA